MMVVLLLALLVFGQGWVVFQGRTVRSPLAEFQLTAIQKILATISIIVLVVALGLLLAKGR
jgi:hypothetical protein